MADSSAVVQAVGWRAVSRYQWLVFLVVWAGWTLDAADFSLFALVLKPALTNLLGFPVAGALDAVQTAQIGKVGGLLIMTGLLGWAAGGFIFGVFADYIGRVRALMFSIALYSVFTALQGLSVGPWDLGVYRFLAGIGTGAEIIVGIPLLAETLGGTQRAKITGIMMTGGAIGTFVAAWVYGLVGTYDLTNLFSTGNIIQGGPGAWRTVFFVGVLPAILLMIIRSYVLEPGRFSAVQQRRDAISAGRSVAADDREFMRFVPAQLFTKQHRFNTFVGLLFGLGSLLTIWTTVSWLPTILSNMAGKSGVTGSAAVPFVAHGMMLWSVGGILGYIVFGFVADIIGRRWTIALYSIGSTALGLFLYLALPTYDPWYPVVLPIFGFFVFGVFSGHAIYFPELFPTQIRSTGVAFCNGAARVITSFGPLIAGIIAGALPIWLASFMGALSLPDSWGAYLKTLGGLNVAAAIMCLFALLSVMAMLMGRETKGDELPH
jgi:MFS family permease